MSINEAVLDISKELKSKFKLETNSGVFNVAEDAYASTLPAGITTDIVESVATHNRNFTAGAVHAYGELSTKALADHPKLESTSFEVAFNHKDVLSGTQHRSLEVKNNIKGTSSIVPGKIDVTIKSFIGNNVGQLKTVRKNAEATAALALAGK